ncbi:MAG TPA: hypothetical protein VNX22_02850 [Acidobacteriaceae bacterium]|nr:hypothetical protein [Acidobacteriaceae bacterium]
MIGRRLQLFAILIALSPLAAVADSITGTVTNGTTRKPSAGDDVTLIRLQQGMQESTHTKTDARGHFTLELPDAGVHLVRVTHDKANYFRPAPPGTQSVAIEVYDAAEKVEGVTVEADVRRYETDTNGLKVVENFFVQNQSVPPRTQFGMHAFEFYLPENAKIEGSAALGPGGMPVQSSPIPTAEKGRYAFLFPIRPGETRFQVTYHLDYPGSLKLTPRVAMPTANVAVMLPKAMQFKPGTSTPYAPVDDDPNAQTFLARNVSPSQPLGFELSGSGQMPREAQGAESGGAPSPQDGSAPAQGGGMPPTAATDTRPGGGLGTPGEAPDPLKKYLWWIVAGVAILFVGAAALLMRKPVDADGPPLSATTLPSAPAPIRRSSGSLLDALKEELFAIETERLEGKLSEQDYAEQKTALEIVLRRALQRQTKAGYVA